MNLRAESMPPRPWLPNLEQKKPSFVTQMMESNGQILEWEEETPESEADLVGSFVTPQLGSVFTELEKIFDTFEVDLLVLIRVQEIFLQMLDSAAQAAAHSRVGAVAVLFDADATPSSRKGKGTKWYKKLTKRAACKYMPSQRSQTNVM